MCVCVFSYTTRVILRGSAQQVISVHKTQQEASPEEFQASKMEITIITTTTTTTAKRFEVSTFTLPG